ncbi:peptide ABC transporter substrate-binding protein [Moorena sp. SIO3F7]|uniref:peptide ABC transporter substrate-binding protein n=1 Tax=Moorena sp. SIO3F7 TaxID=2607839 RepID=UPI0025E8A146|nr:peptide ABC transporter substrate-binding protein [Moorena sp. SIO3F7]
MGRFLTRYYILILLSILCLTGCNSPDSGLLQSNQDSTLKLLYWQAPTILNPHLSNGYKDSEASRITLEPLTSYDKNGEMVLFLAAEVPTVENGGIAADGKSVTWKLKRNVKWSDGTPFTAGDVVFTYEFITNPAVGSTSANTYKTIKTVEAIDDYTVKVNFKDVNPAWFLVFSGSDGIILPRHLYQDFNGANARQAPANLMPVGTGPYQVVEFKPGDTVVYQPNPNFREADKPYFERVELKGGGDATSAARAVLQTGDGDYAYNLQVEAPVLKRLEAGGKGKVVAIFGALVERILMNQTDPNQQAPSGERSSVKFPHSFFKDKRVRQAFNLALDRETIAQQLYGPTGKATGNFLVLPEQYNSPNTTYEFNPKKAVALLEEAGWKDTNGNGIRDKDGVEMTVLFQTSVNPVRQKTQEIVKQTLTSIGVGVELKSIDASIYFSGDPANTDTNQHFYADLQMYTTGNDSPDPGAYLKTYTCDEISQKANQWSRQNVARYCNPKYDQLWQQSTKELDPEKRRKIFIQMNDLLVKDDVVVLPIVHRADPAGFSNQLEGYDLTPWDRNTWNIMDWKRK